eukprot:2928388-Ditylum_brightwellii.AAC.1
MKTLANSAPTYGIHPKKTQMKKQRRCATVSGALGGSIVERVVLGPVGAFVGVLVELLQLKRCAK